MSTADWWARKVADPTPHPQTTVAAPPSLMASQAPAAPPAVGRKAPSHLKASGTCPECGSGNYFVAPHHKLSQVAPAARCFDCGYPVEQSASGMSMPSEGGASAPSRQNNPSGFSQRITEITEHYG